MNCILADSRTELLRWGERRVRTGARFPKTSAERPASDYIADQFEFIRTVATRDKLLRQHGLQFQPNWPTQASSPGDGAEVM